MVTIATIRIIIITDTHTLFPMVFLFMSYASTPHERVTVSSCFAMFAFVFTSSTFSLDRSSHFVLIAQSLQGAVANRFTLVSAGLHLVENARWYYHQNTTRNTHS